MNQLFSILRGAAPLLAALLISLLLHTPAFADTSKACNVVGSEFDPTEAQATDTFINLLSGATSGTRTSVDLFVAPVELIASDLNVKVDVAPGAGDSWVVYFVAGSTRVGGFTCTISGTSKTCNTGTDTALIAGGARLTLAVDSGEGASDPAQAGSIEVSACIRRK